MHGDGPALAVLGGALDGETTFAVAVRDGARIVEARATRAARIELAALVERTLAEAGVRADAVRDVRVDCGPGSYVGLRVAVTFARVLAAFGPARLSACNSTLAAAADRFRGARIEAERLVVLLDGRQERLQFAVHALRDGRVRELEPPALLADADAIARLARGDVVLADPAAFARCGDAAIRAGATCEPLRAASAAVLFAAELEVPAVDPLGLEPLYLTGSYVD